jgi:CRISPR-associated endonuclease Cas1 subtype II
VRAKIQKQADVLREFNHEEYHMLEQYINQLELGDKTNREGHAAKVYFNALFGKEFIRGNDDAVNASLNYGYSIILSAFNRVITASGYITQIGIFHNNMFNCFNLACDLMEPFRPLVDKTVLNMKPKKLEWQEKEKLINILNEEVTICGKKQHCMNAIDMYAKSVFSAIEEKDTSLIKFYEL